MLWSISWCFLQMKDFTSHESSLEGWSLVCYISIAITPNFTCKHHKKNKRYDMDCYAISQSITMTPTNWAPSNKLLLTPQTAASQTKLQTTFWHGSRWIFQNPHLLEHHRPGIALWPCRNQGRPVKMLLRKFPTNKHRLKILGSFPYCWQSSEIPNNHLGWC